MSLNYNLDIHESIEYVDVIESNNNFTFTSDNYINLYIKNLLSEPLKLSLINQNSVKNINLDNININNLDIEFKSNSGLNYNLNTNHILNLIFIICKLVIKIILFFNIMSIL